MKKAVFSCVVILCLALTAGLSWAETISCVCVGAPNMDGCGNGGPSGAKGKTVFVTVSELNNYLKDPDAYKIYLEKGEAYDKKVTGWACKRY